jgi:hypothetical protein
MHIQPGDGSRKREPKTSRMAGQNFVVGTGSPNVSFRGTNDATWREKAAAWPRVEAEIRQAGEHPSAPQRAVGSLGRAART